jgi:hypothetical protein
MTGSSNVQKMVSLGYISAPSAPVAANTVTDVTGAVTLSKNATYANQTIPQPQTGYLLGSFNLVGSTSEDVNLTSIDINMLGAGAGTTSTTVASLNNATMKVNGNIFGTIKGTLATTSTTSTFSGSYTLAKGTTVPVLIYTDIPATSLPNGSDKFQSALCANGTTVNSSANVTSCAAGQIISVGAASISAAQDPSTPVQAMVAGNQTKNVAAFKFTTANDAYTISDITLSIPNVTTVQTITLLDGSTPVGTALPGSASTTFSNLNWQIPANSTKVLTVQVQFGPVGVGAGTTGERVQVTLHSYKNAPSSTGAYTTTTAGTSVAQGNTFNVFKSIPTITNTTWTQPTLAAGTQILYKFTMSSGGSGTIGWAKLGFSIATSSGVTVTSPQVWDADANSQISGAASTTYSSSGLNFEFVPQVEQQVSGTHNYMVKATVAITGTGAKNVSTSMLNPSTSYTAPGNASSVTTTGATFAWSDVSLASHSLTTADWNNDFLVKNLPTDSQTLSASY